MAAAYAFVPEDDTGQVLLERLTDDRHGRREASVEALPSDDLADGVLVRHLERVGTATAQRIDLAWRGAELEIVVCTRISDRTADGSVIPALTELLRAVRADATPRPEMD